MKLAWKELLYEKRKYLLVEGILILMIFMVLFLSGLVTGLGRAVSSGIDNMDADYFWLSDDAESLITVSNLDLDKVEKMKKAVDGEYATIDIMRMYASGIGEEDKTDITYFAIDADAFIIPEIVEGKSFRNDAKEIVLNDSFKEDGVQIGDIISDSSTGIELTVVGFTTDEMYAHIPVGIISTETYTAIRSELNPIYEESVHALAIQGSVDKNTVEGTTLISKEDIIQKLPGYASEQMTISMVLWVMVVISAAILGVFFYVLTIQKEKQFGILKAIGVSMGELCFNLISQILILSLIGTIVGNVLAFVMANFLPSSMPFYLTASNACMVSLSFIAMTVIGGLFSIRKVAKVDPLTSIGGNA